MGRRRGALRAQQGALLPLHVADSPLSRSDDSPDDRDAGPRQAAASTISTGWSCWASIAASASSGPKQAERELMKVKLLTYLAKRIGEPDGRRDHRRRGVWPVRPRSRAARRGADPRRYARATTSIATTARRTAWPAIAAATAFASGDVIRVEVAHVDIDRRELDFRIVRKVGHAGGEKGKRLPPKRGRDRREKPARGAARPKSGRPTKKGRRR